MPKTETVAKIKTAIAEQKNGELLELLAVAADDEISAGFSQSGSSIESKSESESGVDSKAEAVSESKTAGESKADTTLLTPADICKKLGEVKLTFAELQSFLVKQTDLTKWNQNFTLGICSLIGETLRNYSIAPEYRRQLEKLIVIIINGRISTETACAICKIIYNQDSWEINSAFIRYFVNCYNTVPFSFYLSDEFRRCATRAYKRRADGSHFHEGLMAYIKMLIAAAIQGPLQNSAIATAKKSSDQKQNDNKESKGDSKGESKSDESADSANVAAIIAKNIYAAYKVLQDEINERIETSRIFKDDNPAQEKIYAKYKINIEDEFCTAIFNKLLPLINRKVISSEEQVILYIQLAALKIFQSPNIKTRMKIFWTTALSEIDQGIFFMFFSFNQNKFTQPEFTKIIVNTVLLSLRGIKSLYIFMSKDTGVLNKKMELVDTLGSFFGNGSFDNDVFVKKLESILPQLKKLEANAPYQVTQFFQAMKNHDIYMESIALDCLTRLKDYLAPQPKQENEPCLVM